MDKTAAARKFLIIIIVHKILYFILYKNKLFWW